MSVAGTASVCVPVRIVFFVKLGKDVAKTDEKQAEAVAVHRILCRAKEDEDWDGRKDGDVAAVHVDKGDAVRGQKDDV